jgi:hypothetical protein
VIFYTSKVTPSRIKRAKEFGAYGVTADPAELEEWVRTIATSRQNYKNHGIPAPRWSETVGEGS